MRGEGIVKEMFAISLESVVMFFPLGIVVDCGRDGADGQTARRVARETISKVEFDEAVLLHCSCRLCMCECFLFLMFWRL